MANVISMMFCVFMLLWTLEKAEYQTRFWPVYAIQVVCIAINVPFAIAYLNS